VGLVFPRPRVSMLRASRTLAILNVIAVGAALAAFMGSILAICLGHGIATVASLTLPTAAAGTLWALLLRARSTVGGTRLRWGWLASLPIAYLNSVVAIYFSIGREISAGSEPEILGRFFGSAFLGIFAAIAWGPALLVTLTCFGVPIAWAERLGKEGLAGMERGEALVGGACLALSGVAFGIASYAATRAVAPIVGAPLLYGFAALGVATGGTALLLSLLRERRRRVFLGDTEAGRIPGYRVEPTAAGKRLLRVTSQGEGYRVADLEEELLVHPTGGSTNRAR